MLMGLLVDGRWCDRWYDTATTGGRFVRSGSAFRNWVTPDGAPGASGGLRFIAEPNRYHLYVSLACPWAHRTLIIRALKGLEALISVSVVHWLMLDQGWTFGDGPGVIPDPIIGAKGSGADMNRLGFFLGAAAQSNADQGPDVAPLSADLLNAEHLGRRVATVATQLIRGRASTAENVLAVAG